MSRLGIIDWGIGGISVYKLIKKSLDVPVTYFSDTGATPYGKMSRAELTVRLDDVIEFLKAQGVTHLVIGCNAASTAIPFLKNHGIPVEGVIEPAIALTLKLKPKSLGLIGGRRTVLSGVYRRGFAAGGIWVRQRIAQPLSALIESGETSSQTVIDAARQILTPIRNCSHILLACTHYPAIIPVMQTLVSPQTTFIDPASQLVRKVARWQLTPEGTDAFITTGDPDAMKNAAAAAFGVKIKWPSESQIPDQIVKA